MQKGQPDIGGATKAGRKFLKGFFRKPRKKDDLPYSLSGRKLYILPTRQGLFFLIVLLVMLLGSLNYNNNPGFLFTFLLGSMALISMLHTHKNLSGIVIVSASAKPVFAKDTIRLQITIRPTGIKHPLMVFCFSGEEAVEVTLNGKRDHTIEVPIRTNTRGIYHPPPLTVSTRYPFGLFRAWSKPELNIETIVYPEAVACTYSAAIEFSGRENDGRIETAGVEDFKELRSYNPGDSLNRVSWKSLSKGRGLLTKEFIGYTGASIIIDWNEIHGTDPERRLSCLCDMVLKAHNMNHSYGLRLPGKYIEPGEAKDALHRQKCLMALALFNRGTVDHE